MASSPTASSSRSTGCRSRSWPIPRKRSVRLSASGKRRACTARNTWVLSEPPSSSMPGAWSARSFPKLKSKGTPAPCSKPSRQRRDGVSQRGRQRHASGRVDPPAFAPEVKTGSTGSGRLALGERGYGHRTNSKFLAAIAKVVLQLSQSLVLLVAHAIDRHCQFGPDLGHGPAPHPEFDNAILAG